MKRILILILLVFAVAYYFRTQVNPSFSIERFDKIRRTGYFSFGGDMYSFGPGSGMSIPYRGGWVLKSRDTGNLFRFDLYRNGQFISTLRVI